jgi:hypothetical protein
MSCGNLLLRLLDAYFLYFILQQFINDEKYKLQLIKLIWLSTLSVGILSSLIYILAPKALYSINITQGITRYAGLYNDAGGPSYNIIMSLVFGSLYLELKRKKGKLIPPVIIFGYVFTILVTFHILAITLTKSAVLMLATFLVMWIGIYKRKTYIILPLIIVCSYYIYYSSERVQDRLSTEIALAQSDEITMDLVRRVGTGRGALWERTLKYYVNEYNTFQKMFGSSRGYGAHNQYIAYLMRVGIIGLAIFLVIFFRFFYRLFFLYSKYKKPELYMGIVLLTIFLVYGLTGHPFDYTTMQWYLMVFLSLINVKVRDISHYGAGAVDSLNSSLKVPV